MPTTKMNTTNTTTTMNNDDNNKMNTTTATRSINISFQGASRDVDLATPITLAGLQAAIASTFKVDLPPHSGAAADDDETSKDSGDLRFTYKDPEGDDIVFDKDSELSLALRLCPTSLEISAAVKEKPKPDAELKVYQVAARNLREYNGVPSMTPPKLTKTLAFLKLNPRRLVKQGLAPKALLAGVSSAANNKPQPLGDDHDDDNNEDLVESVAAAGIEMMNVDEDDKKEWNDGFVSVESAATPAAAAPAAETSAYDIDDDDDDNDDAVNSTAPSSSDSDGTSKDDDAAADDATDANGAPKKDVLHEAFLAVGIQLRPREVRPLLLALGVQPRRLVRLGYVDAKYFRALLEAENKRRNGRHARMARGGGAGAEGAGGKRGPRAGLMMMVPRRLHPHPHPVARLSPSPPPAHVEEDGMLFVPANNAPAACGGGGRRGGRPGGRPDAHHPSARLGAHCHPHPHAHAHRGGNGKGGPPRMVRASQRGGLCGGGQQH